jgi:hypothetical protein
MAQQNAGWNLFSWWKKREGKQADRRRALALETLEGRVVPATVTTLLDDPNPSTPLYGSLRWAISSAKQGEVIDFAPSLFASGTPQTLTLNGAVGSLRAIADGIRIDGPGVFTSGPNQGQYKLKIQADTGVINLFTHEATSVYQTITNTSVNNGFVMAYGNSFAGGNPDNVSIQVQTANGLSFPAGSAIRLAGMTQNQDPDTGLFSYTETDNYQYGIVTSYTIDNQGIGNLIFRRSTYELSSTVPNDNFTQWKVQSLSNIVSGGTGFRVGDFLQQGTQTIGGTTFGGGRFQVTAVGPRGEVRDFVSINGGANSNISDLIVPNTAGASKQSRFFDETATGQFNLQPISGSGGSGFVMGYLEPSSFGSASDLLLAQVTAGNTSTVTVDDLEFGRARYSAIVVNQGSLVVDSCLFANPGGSQAHYIKNMLYSGALTVNNSTFTSNITTADADVGGPGLIVKKTGFTNFYSNNETVPSDPNKLFENQLTLSNSGVTGATPTPSLYIETDTGVYFQAGRRIELEAPGSGGAHFFATITYFNPVTGLLAFEADKSDVYGSGTYFDWTVKLLGNIIKGGSGFAVGDMLRQGGTFEDGYALFMVTAVDSQGAILGVTPAIGGDIEKPAGFIGSQDSKQIYQNGSGTTHSLTVQGSSRGTGAVFGNFSAANFGSGYLRIQTTPASQVNFFGSGEVIVNHSRFENAINSITVANTGLGTTATNLTIETSSFTQGGVISEANNTIINNTYFKDVLDGALELGASNTTITNSFFEGNNRSTGIQINPTTLENQAQQTIQIGDASPLYELVSYRNWAGATVTKVQPETAYSGLVLNQEPLLVRPNPNRGGGAVFAWDGRRLMSASGRPTDLAYTLNISKTVFNNNTAEGINTFNSGGGAVYSSSGFGTVRIDQTGFTGNSASISAYPSINQFGDSEDFAANPENMPSAANSGGGALYSGGSTTLTNSYLNDNTLYASVDFWTTDSAGTTGIPQYSGGGAIYLTSNDSETTSNTIQNTTLANNQAIAGESGNPDANHPRITNQYIGAFITDLQSADFNHDGVGDLAVGTNEVYENIDIRLGTDSPLKVNNYSENRQYLSTGYAVVGLTAGDFNGDGWQDLAALVNIPIPGVAVPAAYVYVFMNQGVPEKGTSFDWLGFASPVRFRATTSGVDIEATDLNQDGIDDLVVGSSEFTGTLATATSPRPIPGTALTLNFTTINIRSGMNSLSTGYLDGNQYPDILMGFDWDGATNAYTILNRSIPNATSANIWGTPRGWDMSANFDGQADLVAVKIADLRGDGNYYWETITASKTTIWTYRNLNDPNLALTLSGAITTRTDITKLESANLDNTGGEDIVITQDTNAPILTAFGNNSGSLSNLNSYDYNGGNGPFGSKGAVAVPVYDGPSNSSGAVNIVLGQSLIGNPYKGEPGNIWTGQNISGGLNFYLTENNTPTNSIDRPNLPNATKFNIASRMIGLNGGAIVVASGVDDDSDNLTPDRAYNGTTNTTFTNVTITANSLANDYVLREAVAKSSNYSYLVGRNSLSMNRADTGGIFNNTSDSSATSVQNTLIYKNDGINYNWLNPANYGKPSTGLSNTGERATIGSVRNFTTLGNNLYNNTIGLSEDSDRYLVKGPGDIITEPLSPVFTTDGLGNFLGPVIGLNPFTPFGTSTTSETIGTGTKTFAYTATAGVTAPQVGDTVRVEVVRTGTPAYYLEGVVQNIGTTSITLNATSTSGLGTYSNWTLQKKEGPPDMAALNAPELVGTTNSGQTVPLAIPGVYSFTSLDIQTNTLNLGDTVRLEAGDLTGAFLEGKVAGLSVVSGVTTFSLNVSTQGSVAGPVSYWMIYSIPNQNGQANILTMALDRLSPARDSGSSTPSFIYYDGGDLTKQNTATATQNGNPPSDARGVSRWINWAVDMGAFEVQTATLTSAVLPASGTYATPFSVTIQVEVDPYEVNQPGNSISGLVNLYSVGDPNTILGTGLLTAIAPDPITGRLRAQAIIPLNTGISSLLPAGTSSYIAAYTGDTNYAISQSNSFPITVNPAATTVSLNQGTPNPAKPTESITFTGTVASPGTLVSPTGTVVLEGAMNGSGSYIELGKATSFNPSFSITVPGPWAPKTPGVWNIRARFAPSNPQEFESSTSNLVSQSVGYQSTLGLTVNPTTVTRTGPGSTTTFQATQYFDPIGNTVRPNGTVQFVTTDGYIIISGVTGVPNGSNQLVYTSTGNPSTVPVGTHGVIARFVPDTGDDFLPAVSPTVNLTITGITMGASLTVSPSTNLYGGMVNLQGTLTPLAGTAMVGGTVSFYALPSNTLLQSLPAVVGGTPVTSFPYSTTTIPTGTTSIRMDYSGDLNYEPATAFAPLTITKASSTTTGKTNTETGLNRPLTLRALVTAAPTPPASAPSGTVEFFINDNPVPFTSGAVNADGTATGALPYTPATIGSFVITSKYSGDTNYLPSETKQTVNTVKLVEDDYFLTAPDNGSIVQVQKREIDSNGAVSIRQVSVIQPFGPSYTRGFTLARGDINGDGITDLVYAGRTGGLVQILNGKDFSPLGSFYPFGGPQGFPISLAVGDLDGDGKGDLIAAPGGIGAPPNVVIFNATQVTQAYPEAMASFYAYSTQFLGGVSVAAGEVAGGGSQEVITAPLAGAPPHIAVFQYDPTKPYAPDRFGVIQSYYAYSPLYRGGTDIAAADLNGDGFVEIITGASAAAPHVVVIDSRTQSVKASFYAGYGDQFGGGIRVTTLDYDKDGKQDIITSAGPGRPPQLFVYDGELAYEGQVLDPAFLLDSLFAFGPGDPNNNFLGGTNVG